MPNIIDLKQKYHNKIDLLDLELIISRVIKKPREFVIVYDEFKIIKNYELKITNYIKRRMHGEPLAYIFGQKEFYGLKFKVDKNTLVPRPETEMMVEEAINIRKQKTKNRKQNNIIFIDVGTGSGNIIISVAKNITDYGSQITDYFGIDISKPALQIARQNTKFHQVDKQIKFLQGNLLKPIIKNKKYIIPNTKYIILANLPYLTPTQIKNSPTIHYEPKLALTAGSDGLKYYGELFKQIKLLRVSCYVLCEIDPSQTIKIKKLIKNNFPESKTQIKKDLRGLDRIAIIAA